MPRKPKSKSKGSSARPLAAEAEEDVVAARTFLAAEGLAGSLAGHSGEEMMSRVMAMLTTADAAGPVAKWLARCEKACGAVPSADSLALQSEALWLLVNLTGGRFALPRYGDAGAVEEEGGEDDDVGLGGSLGGGGAGLGATSDAAFGAAAVLGNGILPVLVALLGSSRLEVVERAAWVVGNVAGVGVGARDAVLSARVAGVLCSLVEMVCASVKQWLVRFDTMQGAVTGAGSAGKRPRRRASKGGRALSGARRPAHGHADDGGNSDGEDGASSGGASSGGTSSEYDEDNSDDDDDDALPVSATRPHSGALASAVASLAAAGASVRPLPGPSERVPPVIVDRAPELLRVLVWSLARLCDGLPRAGTSPAVVVPALVRVLELHASEGPPFLPAATHAAWALSHRCDGSAPDIRLALRLGALPLLVGLLRPDRSVWRLCKPALRAVGNIVCAEDDRDFTDEVVAAGAVPRLASLVGHPNREIEKEACWTLSNIAAGTDTQIQSVIDSQRLPALADVALSAASDPGVRTEASWVILNATSCGSDAQVAPLVHAGAVRVLACLLADSAMGQMAAEGLSKLLRVSERLMEASDSRGG
ncbi:hypothetical protein FNF29_02801 [Cafeteria roenbergensis]|uniref:Importin subunit alpha n=1 Tax=Cafeteria roenbergensis TaxID=33653 RepID=A0A5A8CL28_CAFRO|nr:hypothetical protein FNF29_02801 [Cafeteria roenbergensis]|eukprot:KAA0153812.1 hypothetical protein FNF29_02801 [Cafeteria roenbergensis]